MLRACIRGHDPLVILGLSDGNIMRLKAGQPINVDLSTFGVDIPGELLVFYGATEADMEVMLRKIGAISEVTECIADPRCDQEAAIRAEYSHILIATVGLPRSGKSTWAKDQGYPVVCPDAIRLALHGQVFNSLAEPHVWAIAKTMARALFLAGHKHVILDATNTTRKRRDDWKSQEWGLFFKHFDTSPEVCHERATETGREDLHVVIDHMEKEKEPLGKDEKLWP